jgi:ferric-dicitrate binding protein FerR (iron transport regulator)
MVKKINTNKLNDFSKGKYSYNDYLLVKSWFKDADKDKELEMQLHKQWNEILQDQSENDQSFHYIFDKIQHNILIEDKKSNKRNLVWNIYRSAAAILLVPVLIVSIWILFSKQEKISASINAKSWIEINAPEAARVEFLLPDSTRGWLNGGSKLKYASDFNENRKVELKGEAYFEVKHRNQSEFIVGLNKLNVKVLGTKFNISDYASDFLTEIVLLEGKVEVSDKTGSFKQDLSPDQKITYDVNNQSSKMNDVDAKRYAAWKDGFLIIDNEPLGQAISRIERWYNTEIVIQNEVLKSYRFKATFKDEPLEEVLRLITITTPIKYVIEKRNFETNGILKKKKVTIELKK